MSESSTGSHSFMPPTGSEHKFHKTGIKNWLPTGFICDRLDWEPKVLTATLCSITNGESLKVLHTHP